MQGLVEQALGKQAGIEADLGRHLIPSFIRLAELPGEMAAHQPQAGACRDQAANVDSSVRTGNLSIFAGFLQPPRRRRFRSSRSLSSLTADPPRHVHKRAHRHRAHADYRVIQESVIGGKERNSSRNSALESLQASLQSVMVDAIGLSEFVTERRGHA